MSSSKRRKDYEPEIKPNWSFLAVGYGPPIDIAGVARRFVEEARGKHKVTKADILINHEGGSVEVVKVL